MPLDAICLAAVREELSGRLSDMKIDKISQPERDMIVLSLRGSASPCRLLISAGSGDARVHLTEYQFENPKTPPMFCMLLRKHLIGARIVSIEQPKAERILLFRLSAPDALGDISEKQLIVELIGRRSNVILVDSEMIIIDCLRRIGGELTDSRAVLPGLIYRPPAAQEGKLDPLTLTLDEWDPVYDSRMGKTVESWLLTVFSSLSPLICRELAWRAYGDTGFPMTAISDDGAALRDEFFKLVAQAKSKEFEAWLLSDGDNRPVDFSYTRIDQYENVCKLEAAESFSALLDEFFTRSAQIERVRQKAAALTKTLKNARDRQVRKLAIQKEEQIKTGERDILRQSGDIITANIHHMQKGQGELVAEDFYSEDGAMRKIKLDVLKTPQQNAASYYKAYTKAKNAEKHLAGLLESGERELYYLESVLEEIAIAQGEMDLLSIREELMETGYVKAQKNPKQKQSGFSPMRFESSQGILIYAGRNNLQNDQLTFKTAHKSDVWLHTQKIHGTHVVISCGGNMPDDVTLYEAASIAAHFSSARWSGKVPVDYTFIKNVKKPSGGRPGMVIYTDYKTILANPDEELVNRLRKD